MFADNTPSVAFNFISLRNYWIISTPDVAA